MILVTAANGNQCRPLIPKLIAAGQKVRALKKTGHGQAELLDLGVSDVVVGDMTDPRIAAKALDGVSAVYHVGPAAHPQERELGLGMIDAAQEAGIEHFVYSSVLHPILTGLLQHERKRDVEEHLVESSLKFTILQPSDFFQTTQYREAFETGVFKLVWGGDKRQSLVDLEDLADIACKVLVEGAAHYGATYEITSGDCLSPDDIAGVIADVTGKPVQSVVDDVDNFLRTWFGDAYDRDRMPSEYSTFKALSDWYWHHDFVGNPNVTRMLLGREPTTYREFIRREYSHRHESLKFAGQGKQFEPLA